MRRLLDDAGFALTGRSVLALCSGGADSVALVELLAALPRGAAPGELQVLWLDHGLREDVAAEHDAAAMVARRHELTLHVRRAATSIVDGRRGGAEAAARAWRYGVAIELAGELGCDVVATGHSASDQVEQALLALVGVTGRPGRPDAMPVRRALADAIDLMRPLLALDRTELEQVCLEAGLAWIDDPTNADPEAHRRNAVRHEIVPRLLDVHPGAGMALVRAGIRERESEQAMRALVDSLLDAWGSPNATLDVRQLTSLPAGARRQLVARWLDRGGVGRGVSSRTVEAVSRLCEQPVRRGESACVQLAGGACVRRDGYDLHLTHTH